MAVMKSWWRQDACLQTRPLLEWRGIVARICWTVVLWSDRVGNSASIRSFGRAFLGGGHGQCSGSVR